MRHVRSMVWVGLAAAVAACGGETRGGLFEGGDAAGAAQSGTGGAGKAGSGGTGNAGRSGGGTAGTGGASPGAGRSNSGGASGGTEAATGGSGGKSVPGAGAPSAGTSSGAGGSAGTPTMTATGGRDPNLMDAPANCEPVSQSGNEKQCNFEYTCDGKTNFTSCQREEDGSWACDCGTFSGASKLFEIGDMPALEACGAVARACKSDLTPGARTCKAKTSTSVTDRCDATATCGPTLELADGHQLRAIEEYAVQCRTGGQLESGFTCYCKGGPLKSRNFETSGKSVESLCGPFLDFCTADEEPVFSGESCDPADTQSNGGQGCYVTQNCRGTSALGSGVSLIELRNRYVACEPLGGGKSYCDCQDGVWVMSIEAAINASQPSMCTPMLNSCKRGLAVEETGSATCKLAIVDSPNPETCNADLTCDQAVRINGTNLLGHGLVALGCQQDPASGSWWCSCASNWDSARFELGSAADAVSACSGAVTHCQSELETFVGLYDRYPELPAPLP